MSYEVTIVCGVWYVCVGMCVCVCVCQPQGWSPWGQLCVSLGGCYVSALVAVMCQPWWL